MPEAAVAAATTRILTGVAVIAPEGREAVVAAQSRPALQFKHLSEGRSIADYLAGGEWSGKGRRLRRSRAWPAAFIIDLSRQSYTGGGRPAAL
jgi:hypothetical protein